MCVPVWQRSRKKRLLLAVANVCLFSGIALGMVMHPASALGKNWLEGSRGLLMGLSIGMNLMVLRFGRNCRVSGEKV